MKQAHYVEALCERLNIVGTELRAFLAREIKTKLVLRQARDIVLLAGPTGTGKERIAAACHEACRELLSRDGELVYVNCANLGHGVFESELFGYRRGAYTGADRDHAGLIGRAKGGTLVLDEIQSLELQDQARLLRFLGEREYRAVGSDITHKADVLIILATNCDLRDMVQAGKFRRDVLDRAAAKIVVPPLWQRGDDIAELAQAFALEAGQDIGAAPFVGLTRQARNDVEAAVIASREVSVRRLREIIRNAVFFAAADLMPEAIESDILSPILVTELNYHPAMRNELDAQIIEKDFDLLVGLSRLHDVASRHGVSAHAMQNLCQAMRTFIEEMNEKPRSYRNVVERTNRLTKIALWLISGAQTQAEFRKYFGTFDAEMPPKSVAHQIYYEVFPKQGFEGDVA